MLSAWFISDVHVVDELDDRGQKLLQFLKSLTPQNATHLFLVGDIFDLWLASHKYFVQRYPQILNELIRLRDAGIEVHYFEGNHDLYLTDYFATQIGFQVHRSFEFFKLGPWTVRVEHGDQVDRDDHGYLFLRWLLRTWIVTWLAIHLPGKIVAALGEFLSRHSRTYTSKIKTISNDLTVKKLRAFAVNQANNKFFDFLITGHVHVRDDFRFGLNAHTIRAINLGTWLETPSAFLLTERSQEFFDLC